MRKTLAIILVLCTLLSTMLALPVGAASTYKTIRLWKSAVVTANSSLRGRTGPGTGYPIVKSFAKNSTINVSGMPVAADGYNWLYSPDNGAWVASNYLRIDENSGFTYFSGTVKIKASYCDKYVSYVTTSDGANIVLYDDLAGTDLENLQLFNLNPIGYFSDCGTVWYYIRPASNADYSLDQDVNDNQATQLWSTHSGDNQKWILEVTPSLDVRVINLQTRNSLDVCGGLVTENNTDLITYAWHGGANQRFILVDPYQIEETLSWPCQSAWTVTTLYYYNTRNNGGMHSGYTNSIDIGGNGNVLAAKSGTVEKAGWSNGGLGNRIIIRHEDGSTTTYGHLSKIDVTEGQWVNAGSTIGVIGSTGNSSGPHLHIEWSGGNPSKVFREAYGSKITYSSDVLNSAKNHSWDSNSKELYDYLKSIGY